MFLVIGEYERDYGFFLPKPVSVYLGCLRLRFQAEWYTQKFQKMKILGVRCWHIIMRNNIQFQFYSKRILRDGGTDGILYVRSERQRALPHRER